MDLNRLGYLHMACNNCTYIRNNKIYPSNNVNDSYVQVARSGGVVVERSRHIREIGVLFPVMIDLSSFLFVWAFSSHSRIFYSYGDMRVLKRATPSVARVNPI